MDRDASARLEDRWGATSGALPPALSTLLDVAGGLLRQAPSARVAIARAGGILEPAALPVELRELVEREVADAQEATCVRLSPKEVEGVLRGAWGRRPARVVDELDPEPLAVRPASQVHRAMLDGDAIVVKVRRPGVERSVRNDLALLDALAPPLRAAFPELDGAAVLRDARELTLDELDFEHEGSQQRRVARALRAVPGVTVPRVRLDLCRPEVLVSDELSGRTLADGELPPEPAEAARRLVAAFRAAVLGSGLAPVDPRATHVVIGEDGTLGLLGLGVARAVDRDRAQEALSALRALGDDDAEGFANVVAERVALLPRAEATQAHGLLRDVLAELLRGAAQLDADALRLLADRASEALPELARLGALARPRPEDLSLARMLGQLVAVLARLRVREDWVGLAA